MVFIKNLLRITILILMVTGIALGRDLTGYGVKVGLNMAKVIDAEVAAKTNPGLALGGFAIIDLDLPLFIHPEVMFSQKGYKWELVGDFDEYTSELKYTHRTNYIDINILVVYPVNDRVFAFVGPYISPFLSGKAKTEVNYSAKGEISPVMQAWFDEMEEENSGEEDIESDDANGMDMGFVIGFGYDFGTINLEARYGIGLRRTKKIEGPSHLNSVIQIIAGYRF